MRGRDLVVAGLIVGLLMASAATATRAGTIAPTCKVDGSTGFVTATKWLDAPGTLLGTAGDDVLIGSTGIDVIKGLGGNDMICPEPGDFTTIFLGPISLAPDQIDAGSGDDFAFGAGLVKGGSGRDDVGAVGTGSRADGGSGDDEVAAFYGAAADGGSGNDALFGLDAGRLLGGSGGDEIVTIPSAGTAVDCGSAFDGAIVNSLYAPSNPGQPSFRRCEVISIVD